MHPMLLCIRPCHASPAAQVHFGPRPSSARSPSRIKLHCWETIPKRRDCDCCTQRRHPLLLPHPSPTLDRLLEIRGVFWILATVMVCPFLHPKVDSYLCILVYPHVSARHGPIMTTTPLMQFVTGRPAWHRGCKASTVWSQRPFAFRIDRNFHVNFIFL